MSQNNKLLARCISIIHRAQVWFRNWLRPKRWQRIVQGNRQLGELKKQITAKRTLTNGRLDKTVLLLTAGDINNLVVESVLMEAFRLSGYKSIIVGPKGRHVHKAWKMLGVDSFYYFQSQLTGRNITDGEREFIKSVIDGPVMGNLSTVKGNLVNVERNAAATLMRDLKIGVIDLEDKYIYSCFEASLSRSVEATRTGEKLIQQTGADAVILFDRGHTPRAEVFDVSIGNGIPVFTLNAGHGNNRIAVKRYTEANSRDHFLTLSDKSWQTIRSWPWGSAMSKRIKDEFYQCYASGEWYGEGGVQFDKKMVEKEVLIPLLNLDPAKKIAVIYPHIFWDGTFFWGDDLFSNYQEWFIETIKAAIGNTKLNWIVKIHPANLTKALRDGYAAPQTEMEVIGDVIGELPANFCVLEANTEISTLSIHQLSDYCVTVRGTVGLEAACFGATVLTAGTGRYGGRGFTIDSTTRHEYLERIRTLGGVELDLENSVELAERYAYGSFLSRTLPLESVSMEYEKNDIATLRTRVNWNSWEEFSKARDVQSLKRWIMSGEEDYLVEDYWID